MANVLPLSHHLQHRQQQSPRLVSSSRAYLLLYPQTSWKKYSEQMNDRKSRDHVDCRSDDQSNSCHNLLIKRVMLRGKAHFSSPYLSILCQHNLQRVLEPPLAEIQISTRVPRKSEWAMIFICDLL